MFSRRQVLIWRRYDDIVEWSKSHFPEENARYGPWSYWEPWGYFNIFPIFFSEIYSTSTMSTYQNVMAWFFFSQTLIKQTERISKSDHAEKYSLNFYHIMCTKYTLDFWINHSYLSFSVDYSHVTDFIVNITKHRHIQILVPII